MLLNRSQLRIYWTIAVPFVSVIIESFFSWAFDHDFITDKILIARKKGPLARMRSNSRWCAHDRRIPFAAISGHPEASFQFVIRQSRDSISIRGVSSRFLASCSMARCSREFSHLLPGNSASIPTPITRLP